MYARFFYSKKGTFIGKVTYTLDNNTLFNMFLSIFIFQKNKAQLAFFLFYDTNFILFLTENITWQYNFFYHFF